jgi:hypothetical protein
MGLPPSLATLLACEARLPSVTTVSATSTSTMLVVAAMPGSLPISLK